MAKPRSTARAGRLARQPTGYLAFEPAPLPRKPPVKLEGGLGIALAEAERALGRLDGVATTLPNPDRFVAMHVRREAVLSFQIEGAQASLTDLLQYEAGGAPGAADVGDVMHHLAALNHGLERLATLPLSLRPLREVHGELMKCQRGGQVFPGEFRTPQNWIGPAGAMLAEAAFVPPPPATLMTHLGAHEKFLHARDVPLLVQAGLAHAQFETIHPFVDGNGRLGRLLITLMLCERGGLSRPLLYLSLHLKKNRAEYYARLQAIREEDQWEEWLAVFLESVREAATESANVARRIPEMREQHRALIGKEGKAAANRFRIHEQFFIRPYISIDAAAEDLELTKAGAGKLVDRLKRPLQGRFGIALAVVGCQGASDGRT